MKTRLSLIASAMLLLCSTAFSANGSAYYNLRSGMFGELTLSQEPTGCTLGGYYNNCVASVKDTPVELAKMLKQQWTAVYFGSRTLSLGSDIDLGEFNAGTAAGSCVVNHVPLEFPTIGEFKGNGYTIRNLCYSGAVDKPIGFFGNAAHGDVTGVKISGVRIYAKSASHNGADYYPVGAFAGTMDSIHVDGADISDITIDAPVAGGFVGYLSNCTVENVRGDDDIFVSNSTSITQGYAGSAVLNESYGYNAFLGGLVGVAVRDNDDSAFSFANDSVKVEVSDKASGHRSALGGIAGAFLAVNGSAENLTVYTKKNAKGEVIPSRLTGGSAMGGVFGLVANRYENMSPKEGVVVLSKFKFDGEIGEASSAGAKDKELISIGGIVGRDSILSLTSLRIGSSSVTLNVTDSLKVAGDYRYMVGGILGSSNNCNNSKNDTSYVSIRNSRTSGKVSVAGSGAAVNGLHMQTFAGGIAGYACLASDGNGAKNDTSSITFDIRTKTAYGLTFNGAAVFDSVVVGGIVGHANNSSDRDLTFYQDVYTGSIKVLDSLNTVVVGGLVGEYPEANGGKTFAFEKSLVKSAEGIKHTAVAAASVAKTINDKQIARIGGLCGYCREVSSIGLVGVSSNILSEGTYSGDSILVGGLLGNLYSNEGNSLTIKTAYANGDILVSSADAEKVKAGFLIGSGIVYGKYTFTSDYHYSENDEVSPFGVLYTGTDVSATWRTNKNISYVIRNDAESRDKTPLENNGYEFPANMKKASFAGFLNESLDPYGWSFEKGTNGDLPFPVDASHAAVAPSAVMTFKVNFMDYDGKTLLSTQTIREGYSAVAPEEPSREGYDFTGWDKAFNDIESDLTVTAVYEPHRFYVIFHNEAGDTLSGYYGDNLVAYGEAAEAPNVALLEELLAKEGYTFTGWDDSTYKSVVANLDIYPTYKLKTYTLSFADDNDSVHVQREVMFGESIVLLDSIAKAATEEYIYAFKGWSWDGEGELPETMPSRNLALKAVYDSTKVKYEVVFLMPEGTQIGEAQQVEYGSAAVAPEAPVRKGSTFAAWKDSSYTNVVKNLVVEALYDTITFKVTFLDYKDDIYDEGTFEYEADLSTVKPLERPSTEEYTYTFKSWSSVADTSEKLGVLLSDMTVKAMYDSAKVKYEVVFQTPEGTQIGEVQQVEYGSAAVAPEAPVRKGSTFAAWKDSSYTEVVKNLVVEALYDTVTFKVTFLDYKDSVYYEGIFKYEADMSIAMPLERPSTVAYTYTFKDWSSVADTSVKLGVLLSDMTVKALYDSSLVKYEVTYKDYDGTQIGEVQLVEYGSAAVPPAAPFRAGYDFAGWSKGGDTITKSVDIYALYEPVAEMVVPEVKILNPVVDQSGNAIRVAFDAENANPAVRTDVRVMVMGEYGLILDTLLTDSMSETSSKNIWEMYPAPMGKFSVELFVSNEFSADSLVKEFEVASEIQVTPRSWQMVSLSALESSVMDWGHDASFYWWDETNPIGDYWQYRSFDGGEIEATRGFWYGTSEGKPLVLRETTGAKDSEIVWNLDSLYSGWNLVANPYGWYVDLKQGKADDGSEVEFWRWNPVAAEYEPVDVIGPYEAVWVKVPHAMEWHVSAAPHFGFAAVEDVPAAEKAKALRKGAARKASANSWTLLASLSDNYGRRDSWNVIGAGASAETMAEPPAGMGDRVSLAVLDGKKKLAKFVKASADEYEWELSVSSNKNREGNLGFDGVEELQKLGLGLFVTVDGKTTELKAGETVKVALAKEAKKVNVRVASAAKSIAAAGKLGGLRFTQADGSLQMQFTAADNLAGASARYTLVDVKGKQIAAGSFTAAAGTNSFAVKAPKAGIYFMQLKVGSQMSASKVLVK